MIRRTLRGGFTLLEMLVFSAIALVVMGVAWFAFFSATNQSKKLDARLRALQANQIFIERIKQDLKQFYYVPNYSMVEPSPPRLSFRMYREYAYSKTERSQASVILESVNYTFDRELHLVRRNNELLRACPFENVSFGLKETGPGTGGELSNSITIQTVYVSEELLSTPDRITDRDRIPWFAMMGLPHRSLIETSPFWQENPFDHPPSF